MKKLILLLAAILLAGSATACRTAETEAESPIQETETEIKQVIYENITAEAAKEIMDTETGYVILDVRTAEEFAEGHIKGAILIPNDEITEKAESILQEHRAELDEIAKYLLEKETITGEEFMKILHKEQ